MNADNASILLIAILVVWAVLGAALCDLLAETDWEPATNRHEQLPGARNGTAVDPVANRRPPALSWRRCIRCPKARRRMKREPR